MISIKLLSHIVKLIHQFLLMLDLKLLHKLHGCVFVICHVLVPGLGKLNEVSFLSLLYIEKLLLLGYLHVVYLSLLLSFCPVAEDLLESISHHVVVSAFKPLSHLVQNFQKGDYSLVWQKIDTWFWKECSILFLVYFILWVHFHYIRRKRLHRLVTWRCIHASYFLLNVFHYEYKFLKWYFAIMIRVHFRDEVSY